ncbi:uncharacterized protein [Eucyclogobius newberryi]|uniref:uncharacterized protein n=1 Tax=Eucyclogobius newberryi TaxID=166745 RepID=UPI003B5A442E
MIPFVAGENQAVFDISDALDVVPNSEQSKEEAETLEITDTSDEVTADITVKESEALKDSSGKQLSTDNNSAPSSVEKEETNSKCILRDGKEVCSHCDQFIGLIKLTFSYPPMYLHPDCLKCALCTKILGALLTPLFEHNHRIYCCDCYDQVYSLN